MPFYEYRCTNCKYQFDACQAMADGPLQTCPQCSRDALERLISAPAVHTQGPGFRLPDKAADLIGESNQPGVRRLFMTAQKSRSLKNLGLQTFSRVGNNLVVHPNLVGPPPGSFGKTGQITFFKDDKKPSPSGD